MKLFEKKDFVKIEKDDLTDAKLSSAGFLDDKTKKRAFMDVLGARLAIKMLFSKKIEANNVYSLYTIQNVLKELDIADIYFNGIKIDVRLVFNKEEIFIPKSHFQYSLLPDLYLIIELNKDLSDAEVIGFFEPKYLNQDNQNDDFYFYEYERLQAPDKLKNFLNDFNLENKIIPSDEESKKAQELFLPLVDNEISEEDKFFLFKQLANSFGLREKFVEFENFEVISTEVAKKDDILKDGILDIIAAQQLFEGEGEDVSKEDFKAEVIEEVLSDLLEFQESNEEEEEEGNREQETEDFLNELLPYVEEDETEKSEQKIENFESEVLEEIQEEEENNIQSGYVIEDEMRIEEEETGNRKIVSSEELVVSSDFVASQQDLTNNSTQKTPHSSLLTPNLNNPTFQPSNLPENPPYLQPSETSESEFLFDKLPELDLEFDNVEPEYLKNFQTLEEIQPDVVEETGNWEEETGNRKIVSSEELVVSSDFVASQQDLTNNSTQKTPHSSLLTPNLKNPTLQPSNPLESSSTEEDSVNEFLSYIEDDDEIENFSIEDEQKNEESKEEFNLDDFDFSILDEDETVLEDDGILSELDSDNQRYAHEFKPDKKMYTPETYIENDFAQKEEVTPESQKIFDENPNLGEKDPLQLLFKDRTEPVKSELKTDSDMEELFPTGKKVIDFVKKDKKKMVIAASVASVVIVSFIAGGIVFNGKNNNNIANNNMPPAIEQQGQTSEQLSQNSPDMNQQNSNQNTNFDQQSVPEGNQQGQVNRDMGQAVSDAFLSEPVNATISKVAWEVPEDLAYNDGFRKYLQTAGKNLKLNLQNDLLLSNEMAYSNKVIINLSISKDGSLLSSNIATSSGSKQIDRIVLQSVKDTLSYLKMPADELSGNSANVTLIINF